MNVSKAKSLTINGQPVAKLQVGNVVIWEKGGEPEKWELDEDGYIIGEDGKYYQRYFRIDGEGVYHPDIDLNGQWVEDTVSGDYNIDKNFDYYMSNSNYHVGGGYAQFKVTWSGLESITFLYRSDAESNYDYLVINGLDKPKFTSAPSQSTSGILAHTYGNQTKTYYTLTIDTPDKGEHFVWFCYRKDGSVDSGSDRAFIGVPNNIVKGELIEKKGAELRYDYVESTDFVIAREGYVQCKSYKTYYSPNGLNSFTTDDYILGEEVAATPVNHNYLRFDAVTNSAHIGFNPLSLVSDLQFTRAFEETFAPFPSEGVDIQQGSTIWLRANGFTSLSSVRSFLISQKVECHGDMRYLLNPSDPELVSSYNYAFRWLFASTYITTLPDIYQISGSHNYSGTFLSCRFLTHQPSIMANLSYIDAVMFGDNYQMTELIAPNVSFIRNGGFTSNNKISIISLPKVETIDERGFECYNNNQVLTSLYLPQVTSIGPRGFLYHTALKYVDLPKCVSLDDYVFDSCSNVVSYNLPVISYLASYMFGNFSNLETMNLSDYVIMENQTLSVAPKLSNFSIPAYLVAKGETVLPVSYRSQLSAANFMLPSYHSTFSTATEIEDDVYGINSNVMGANNSLARVSLPYCWYLGAGCFKGCVSLSEVYAPNVRYMESSVFYGCVALKSINFPELSGIIYSNMFYNCPSLTEVNMPKVDIIDTYTFSGKSNLISANFDNVSRIGAYAFQYCRNLTTITMPNVKSIRSHAFYYCSRLKVLDLPNLISIGSSAFHPCIDLETLNIPKLSIVESYAFYNCYNLKTLNADNLEEIWDNGMAYIGLSSHSFPKLKKIGQRGFVYGEFETIDLPVIENIGYAAFSDIRTLKTVNMSMVTEVPTIDSTAFDNCYSAKFYVPSSLVYAFQNDSMWSSLASRIFPYEG